MADPPGAEDVTVPTNSTPSPPPTDATFECDPTAPLPTANDFRRQAIPRIPTDGSRERKIDLCDQRWQWYRLPLQYSREIPSTERVVGPDGITRTVTTTTTVDEQPSVVILFDSLWTRQTNRYPTSDVMIVNGFTNMPLNWDVPSLFNPDNAVNQVNNEKPGTIEYRTGVDSLTLTMGFNTTFSSLGCAGPMDEEYVMVGIRCAWGQALACRYDLSAQLLPRRVYDGDVLEAAIGAGELHTYALDIGSYDIVVLTLLRLQHDLTYVEEDEDTGVQTVRTHDFRFTFVCARLSLENLPLLDKLALLWRPYSMSWSNVVDYLPPASFHKVARLCSRAGDCMHYAYSMNWITEMWGANLRDFSMNYAADEAKVRDLVDKALRAPHISVIQFME